MGDALVMAILSGSGSDVKVRRGRLGMRHARISSQLDALQLLSSKRVISRQH
jgi:hypothetical protein